MYKKTSENMQRRADAIAMRDMPNTLETLTDEQKREILVGKWKKVAEQIKALPKNSQHRKELGQESHIIQTKINGLRPKMKGGDTLPEFFIQAAKDMLQLGQYQLVMKEAFKRLEEFKADKPPTQKESGK